MRGLLLCFQIGAASWRKRFRSEIQGLAGLAASAKTIFDTEDPKATITKTVPKQ